MRRLASSSKAVRGPKITAPVGQTLVHPGFNPLAKRWLHNSHLVMTGFNPSH